MKHGAFFLIHKPKNNHLNDTTPSSPWKKKVRLDKSKGKEFIKEGITINKQAYKEILVRLRDETRRKRNQLINQNIIENTTVELNKLRKIDFELAFQQLFSRWEKMEVLHRIVTGDKKWVHYDYPKRRATYGYPGRASSSTAKPSIHGGNIMLCIWWDRLGVAYYELLQLNEKITGQMMNKDDNTRPHAEASVKAFLETLKCEVLPHPPYSPDITPSDFYLFRSMQHDQHLSYYDEIKKWIDE
ncbi:hypothetical protein LAZ67_4003585 [Cordylochernes scorpioides]|uniref:Transposase n=1 Tax=Cordylochernes scorpioides TaxID=51811 RepID=A0ABY6KFL2_9ARAC|nr:hypothetical protein LAZ67_4003585 [Cordylochernes scorpioides]